NASQRTGRPWNPALAISRSLPPGHSVRRTSACSPPGSMRSHASGARPVARPPASASTLATRRRSAALRYCITMEWKTTLATPGAGAARRAASHAGAPEASTAAGTRRAEQKAAEERGRAPHLVRLHGRRDEHAQRVAVLLERVTERCPGAVEPRLTAGRRVVARERRRMALEHEPMHGPEEAERERRGARVRLAPREHGPRRAACLDVRCRLLEPRRVARRAEARR